MPDDELRYLQDRWLRLPLVQRVVSKYGQDAMVAASFPGGEQWPTYREVAERLFPSLASWFLDFFRGDHMTRAEWLTCDRSADLLRLFGGSPQRKGQLPCPSDRKLRLFACACLRRWATPEWAEEFGHMVALAEMLADGHLDTAGRQLEMWDRLSERLNHYDPAARGYALGCLRAAGMDARLILADDYVWGDPSSADAVRDTFGDPFAPCGWSWPKGVWNNSGFHWTVQVMAQDAYDSRRPDGSLCPDRLGLLADAAEDYGCDQDLIESLRVRHRPCFRGLWSLDTLLEKK